jgi:hypothetical protein
MKRYAGAVVAYFKVNVCSVPSYITNVVASQNADFSDCRCMRTKCSGILFGIKNGDKEHYRTLNPTVTMMIKSKRMQWEGHITLLWG